MKRILGITAALLLGSTLLSSVLADDAWNQHVGGAYLHIDRTFEGNGVWMWTYTLTHPDPFNALESLNVFNAELHMNDGGAVPGNGFWGYAPSVSPYSIDRSQVWYSNFTLAVWKWTTTTTTTAEFGSKVFSFYTVYGDVTEGGYNLSSLSGANQHGFTDMATPIPEPGSLAMLGLAAIGFAGVRRQRQ